MSTDFLNLSAFRVLRAEQAATTAEHSTFLRQALQAAADALYFEE